MSLLRDRINRDTREKERVEQKSRRKFVFMYAAQSRNLIMTIIASKSGLKRLFYPALLV